MIEILKLIVLAFGVKAFGNKTFSITNMRFSDIGSHAKRKKKINKRAKHKAHLKSQCFYLSLDDQ